jgi:hypothetical protein
MWSNIYNGQYPGSPGAGSTEGNTLQIAEFGLGKYDPRIMPASDINFGEVPVGGTSVKTLMASAISVGSITAVISSGEGFAITPDTQTPTDDRYPFTITFSPTEKKIYNATVTLSAAGVDPVSFNLTGNADFDLPVLISTEDNTEEHWYYIQFYRKMAANTVWSLSDSTEMIVQDTLKTGVIRDEQQWKICGNWTDGYYLINKTGTDVQISYNELISVDSTKLADRYYKVGLGDLFDFVRFGTTDDWQFYNRSYAEYNPSVSYVYANDAGGKFLCHYTLDDAGNRLRFIPADVPTIFATTVSLAFDLPQGETATQSLSLLGLNLTDNITATISGDDASAFSFGDGGATLPATGGNLNITFSPATVKTYTATLTLTSGTATLTIAVTGNSDLGLPTISTPGNDVWYYIQLNRKPTTAFTAELVDGNRYDTRVMQRPKTDDNADQHWKFTGNWTTGYSIINKNGGALSFDDITTKRLILIEEEAFGDKFLFKRENSTSRWQFQVVGKNDGGDAYSYVNDYGGAGGDGSLGLYVVNDGGNLLNFFPADGTDVKFPAFDSNDKIVSVKYYTLTGAEVVRPAVSGIYIVRNVYASGRVKAEKQLFVIK